MSWGSEPDRPVVASARTPYGHAPTGPESAVDDDYSTEWFCKDSAAWLKVDLGAEKLINRIFIAETPTCEQNDFRINEYRIKHSIDGAAWTDLITTDKPIGMRKDHKFPPVTARYVMLDITKCHKVNISEFQVFEAQPDPPDVNRN